MKQEKARGRIDLYDLSKFNLGLRIFHCPVSVSVKESETQCEAVSYDSNTGAKGPHKIITCSNQRC